MAAILSRAPNNSSAHPAGGPRVARRILCEPLSVAELFKIGRLDPTRRVSEASARAEASGRSVRPLREELVGRVLVARVQPGLGDLPVLEVEHEHAVVSERPALSLGGRSGQSDAEIG